MPNSRRTNRMLLLAIAAVASYWVLPLFASGLTLQILFNSAVFGVATSILVTWGPAAVFALRRSATGENQNIVAVFAIWFVVWLQRVYSIAFVTLDRPWWLLNSAMPAFLAYLIGMAGVLFLIAPASTDDAPAPYRWRLALSGALGVAFAGFSYWLQSHGFDK